MRYRLRTLLLLVGLAPPAIGAVWHAWGLILLVTAIIALLAFWYLISYVLARLFAEFVASMMG